MATATALLRGRRGLARAARGEVALVEPHAPTGADHARHDVRPGELPRAIPEDPAALADRPPLESVCTEAAQEHGNLGLGRIDDCRLHVRRTLHQMFALWGSALLREIALAGRDDDRLLL